MVESPNLKLMKNNTVNGYSHKWSTRACGGCCNGGGYGEGDDDGFGEIKE